jgi:hypothetical protein
MLGAALAQVSGLYDRRMLLSSFLPWLVVWAASVTVALALSVGLGDAVAAWDKLSPTIKGVAVAGALAWVALWSSFAAGSRGAVERVVSGYSPPVPRKLSRLRRRYWQAQARGLEQRDETLEPLEADLRIELANWYDLGAAAPADQTPIDSRLAALEHALNEPRPTHAAVCAMSGEARACWQSAPEDTSVRERLTTLSQRVQALLAERLGDIQSDRAALHERLALGFPDEPHERMPTELGNALRAAETYGRTRYGLDTAVLWPRLQPLLPTATLDGLRDARAEFDLSVTLWIALLLFGVPLAVWLGVGTTWDGVVPASVLALLVAWAAGSPVAAVVGGAGLVLGVLDLAGVDSAAHAGTAVAATALVLCAARLLYRASIQAAIAYGQVVRSTIDTQRHRALEALQVELPGDLEREQQLWAEVMAHLDHGSAPDPATYRFVQPQSDSNDTKSPSSTGRPDRSST